MRNTTVQEIETTIGKTYRIGEVLIHTLTTHEWAEVGRCHFTLTGTLTSYALPKPAKRTILRAGGLVRSAVDALRSYQQTMHRDEVIIAARARLEQASPTVRRIVAQAEQSGSPLFCGRTYSAVADAAVDVGLAQVMHWAYPFADGTLLDYAEQYIQRYVQAYGPIDGLIDVGAHLGISGRPLIVKVDGE
jgi:hypothetical protein